MAIEIFGFIFKPEMSYADIAGVVALFFTASTFAFGMWQWNRRRRSAQIILAIESMDKINTSLEEFNLVSNNLLNIVRRLKSQIRLLMRPK